MTLELNLLKVMSIRSNLEKYIHLINPKTLSKESKVLLKDFKEYFNKHLTEQEITFNTFSEFFFLIQHINLDEKEVEIYKKVINEVQNIDSTDISCTTIITSFEKQELYSELHEDLDKNEDLEKVIKKLDFFKERFKLLEEEETEVVMDLDLALETTNRDAGLKFRLKSLQDCIGGGLIKSDFVLFCGYVGRGKTTFLASEASFMAQQLKDDQKILWFNNEGNWKKIIQRIYSATLNFTEQELRKWKDQCKEKYKEKMNGDLDRIKVIDIKGKTTKDIERIVSRYNPGLIIIDMLDKVSGFEIYLKGESGATERYNQLYAWAEQLSDISPLIATSQLNGDGCNEEYPLMTNLRGSRVDKQANVSAMIVMGAIEGNNTVRFLSTPKNKLSGREDWRCQVGFDPLRSRFKDLGEV